MWASLAERDEPSAKLSPTFGYFHSCTVSIVFLKWSIPGLFFIYFHLFNTVDSKQMFNINFADGWI